MSLPAAITPLDRLLAAFRTLVRAEDPNRAYRGVWEYIVQATDGTTCDLAPNDPAIPLPAVTKVTMRAGLPGTIGKPAVGTLCYLTFANGDPTKPFILGYSNATAQSLTLDSDSTTVNGSSISASAGSISLNGGPSAARTGDTVNAGYLVLTAAGQLATPAYYPGTTLGASAASSAASALMPPGSVVPMEMGTITGGSSTVTIG